MFLGLFICAITLFLTGLFLNSAFTEENIVKEIEKQKKPKEKIKAMKLGKKIASIGRWLMTLGIFMIPSTSIAYGIKLIVG